MSQRKKLIDVSKLKRIIRDRARRDSDRIIESFEWKKTENENYEFTWELTQHTFTKDSFYKSPYTGETEWYGKKGEVKQYTSKSSHQKFVCVGGPMAGEKLAFPPKDSYVLYNRSSDYAKYAKCPRAAWIYVALVEGR